MPDPCVYLSAFTYARDRFLPNQFEKIPLIKNLMERSPTKRSVEIAKTVSTIRAFCATFSPEIFQQLPKYVKDLFQAFAANPTVPCLMSKSCLEKCEKILEIYPVNETCDMLDGDAASQCILCTNPISEDKKIVLTCDHTFHLTCILEQITTGFSSEGISFTFLTCPLCRVPMHHEKLEESIAPYLLLKEDIEQLGVKKLKEEGMLKDVPAGVTPEEYALSVLAFYQCSKCTKAYYGGLKSCGVAGEGGGKVDKLCQDCFKNAGKACSNAAHEPSWQRKCRFCCSVATWRCWGTTSFCNPCHDRWIYRKTDSFDPIPCLGPVKCPLKGLHPPNGTTLDDEYIIRCAICDLGADINKLKTPEKKKPDAKKKGKPEGKKRVKRILKF